MRISSSPSFIFRSRFTIPFTSTSRFSSAAITAAIPTEYDPSPFLSTAHPVLPSEVHRILQSTSHIEPPLETLAPRLSHHVITSVLLSRPPHPESVRASFLFYAWASRRRRLRSLESHDAMVSIVVRGGSLAFDSAWRVLEETRARGVRVSSPAFNVLVSARARSGSVEETIGWFSRMAEFGIRPTTFTYNTVLRLLIDKRAVPIAVSVFERMIESSDCRPQISTFNILIDGFCKAERFDLAVSMFDEMSKWGLKPGTVTYNTVLRGLCLANQIDSARSLVQTMILNGCDPDNYTWSTLLSGYCRSDRIDEALELLRLLRLQRFELGPFNYSCVIDRLFKKGWFDEALMLYKAVLEIDNVVPDCVLYNVVIKWFSKAGRMVEAFGFFNEMVGRGLVPDVFSYNALIEGLCQVGSLENAYKIFRELPNRRIVPDLMTYTILIHGFCTVGLIGRALELFEELQKRGYTPSVVTYGTLVEGLCKTGRLEDARFLYRKIEMKGNSPPLSVDKHVKLLCDLGEFIKAYELLRDLDKGRGVAPNISLYNILIAGLCWERKSSEALKLFDQLQIRGLSPDAVTYGTLIDGLQDVGRFEDALGVFERMVRNGCAPNLKLYIIITKTLCRMHRVLQAIALWLDYISQRSSFSDWEDEAIASLRRDYEMGSIKDVVVGLLDLDRERGNVDCLPYIIWLIGFCHVGRNEEALMIFDVLTMRGIDVTPAGCVWLVKNLCREGKLDSAMRVMLFALKKCFVLVESVGNLLINRLCKRNRRQEAMYLVQKMSISGYDMDKYLSESNKDHLCCDGAYHSLEYKGG